VQLVIIWKWFGTRIVSCNETKILKIQHFQRS